MTNTVVVTSDMTVAQIIEVAKSHGIKGYSRFNKAQLIEYVNSNLPCETVVEDKPVETNEPVVDGSGSGLFLQVTYDGKHGTEQRILEKGVPSDLLITEYPILGIAHMKGLPRTVTFTDGTLLNVVVVRVGDSRKAVHELSTGVRLLLGNQKESSTDLLRRVAQLMDSMENKELEIGSHGIIDETKAPYNIGGVLEMQKVNKQVKEDRFEMVVDTLAEHGYNLTSYECGVYEVTHTVNEIWALGYDSTELYISLYGGALTGKLEIELLGHYEGMEEITSCEVQLSDDNCDVQALSIIDGIFEEYDARHNEDDEEEEYLDYGEVTNEFMQEVLESSEYAYIFEGTLNDEYIGELDNEGRLHYGYTYYITKVEYVNEYQARQTIFFTNDINAVNNQLNLKALLNKVDDVEEFITFF